EREDEERSEELPAVGIVGDLPSERVLSALPSDVERSQAARLQPARDGGKMVADRVMLDEGLRDESKSQVDSEDADGDDDGQRGRAPLGARQEIVELRPPESSTQKPSEAEEARLGHEEIARTKASSCRERDGQGDLERAPGNERRKQALRGSRNRAASGERQAGRHRAQQDDREGRTVRAMPGERHHD